MWGKIISGIGKAAGGVFGGAASILGGIKAGQQRKKQLRAINDYEADTTSRFQKEYNADYLQRSDNQAALREQQEQINRKNRTAQNTAIVTGATPEVLALQKAAGLRSYGNTISQIARNASAYKTNILNNYQNQKRDIMNMRNQAYGQQAQNWGNLALNGANVLMNSFNSEVDERQKG